MNEEAILDHALDHPPHGLQRIAGELLLKGRLGQLDRGALVWIRHGLTTERERLWLEETARRGKLKLTATEYARWRASTLEFRDRHIETRFPGDLVAVGPLSYGR